MRGEKAKCILTLILSLLSSFLPSVYRVFHQLPDAAADLGLVDFDFGSSNVCPDLLRLMGIWQNWLGQSQPNPGAHADGASCIS